MPAQWTWQLADAAGAALAELTTATGRSLAFRRNTFGEASFTISHDDDAAQLLLDSLANTGIPTLRAYRHGENDQAGVLRFNGYLAALAEAAEEASSVQCVFRGPFARLLGDGQDRGRYTAASVPFTATDAGQIAKGLIDTANAEGATGLVTTGTIQATKSRDRLYQYANVGEAVVALTQVLDGFDFEEVYVAQGATLAVLNIIAAQGQDRPLARFEYGPDTLGNVRSVERATQAPINHARVLGANGLAGVKEDAASILKYGRQDFQQAAADVVEQITLDDKAQALLRPNPVRTVTFVPDLAVSPLPWEDFWLGDTVRFYARRGALLEDVTVRVNGVTVAIDDNGLEVAELQRDELAALEADPAGAAYAQTAADAQATADELAARQTTIDVEIVED